MAKPESTSINPQEVEGLKQYLKEVVPRTEAIISMQEWIFEDLRDPENAAEVINKLRAWTLVQDTPDQSARDGVAEIVNAIVVAAINETKSYEVFYAVIEGLAAQASDSDLWGRFAFQVAEAALFHFPGRTNFFILGMLRRGLIDSYTIFKFLKNDGIVRPENIAVFYYFGPELLALKGKWYVDEWDYIHKEQSEGDVKYDPGIVKVIVPDFPDDLKKVDWAKHERDRETGRGPSEIVNAIRNDDAQHFQSQIAAGDKYRSSIPWSIYEQFLPWDWQFNLKEGGAEVNKPEICQVIGLLGASKCFTTFSQQQSDDVLTAIKQAAGSIVGGGNLEMVHALSDLGVSLAGTLKDAVRFHAGSLFDWLLEQPNVEPDQAAGQAAVIYSNFKALRLLVSPGSFGSKRKPVVFGPPDQQQNRGYGGNREQQSYETIYHICAKYNAVEAFKYLLSLATTFDPYATADKTQTFLHFGCRFTGYDVVRFWCRNWGNMGLNAVDEFNQNPYHYVFMFGINPKPAERRDPTAPKAPYEVRRPFWSYMKKRSVPDYKVSEDPNKDV